MKYMTDFGYVRVPPGVGKSNHDAVMDRLSQQDYDVFSEARHVYEEAKDYFDSDLLAGFAMPIGIPSLAKNSLGRLFNDSSRSKLVRGDVGENPHVVEYVEDDSQGDYYKVSRMDLRPVIGSLREDYSAEEEFLSDLERAVNSVEKELMP